MLSRRAEFLVGLAVMLLAACIIWVLIPGYVTIPRRVPIQALSPSFWPTIIGWTMLLCGGLLALRAVTAPPPPDAITDDLRVPRAEGFRLAALAVLLTVAYLALPVVGMVWTTMVVFVLMVLLTGGKRLFWGVALAIILPLVLYFFFTKVAGVAIPQGRIVRLP